MKRKYDRGGAVYPTEWGTTTLQESFVVEVPLQQALDKVKAHNVGRQSAQAMFFDHDGQPDSATDLVVEVGAWGEKSGREVRLSGVAGKTEVTVRVQIKIPPVVERLFEPHEGKWIRAKVAEYRSALEASLPQHGGPTL